MGTPAKKKVFTFSTGVKVYAHEINGEMFPMEFKSEIACDKFSYKLFMKNIHTTMIKSFNDPKKFYLQIIEDPIG
jgi:hypothetical protein